MIAAEEEGAVAHDGAAEGQAEVVVLEVRLLLGELRRGGEALGAIEVVRAPFELVRAALDDQVLHGARGPAVLRRRVGGDHRELADGLGRRQVGDGVDQRLVVVHAFDLVAVELLAQSVDGEGRAAELGIAERLRVGARSAAGGVAARDAAVHARSQRGQLREVAAVERQVLDLLLIDERGDLRGALLDERRRGGDGHLFVHAAELHLEVDARHLVDGQRDLRDLRLESAEIDLHLVRADRQRGQRVGALLVADVDALGAGAGAGRRHRGPGQHGPGVVGDEAFDARRRGLCHGRQGAENDYSKDCE